MKNQLFFSTFLLLSLLFIVAHITNVNAAAPPCATVNGKAASCLSFAIGKDAKPSPACCNGLQALAQTVKNLDDKKAICRCLKAGVKNFHGVQDKLLSQIPTACKITVGFPVSTSVNCETIH